MPPRGIKSVDCRSKREKEPDTMMRSVLCWRDEQVARDPRKDAAGESQICKLKWGEKKRPDTSMHSVFCRREY
jgi:hypothetical protein